MQFLFLMVLLCYWGDGIFFVSDMYVFSKYAFLRSFGVWNWTDMSQGTGE